MAAEFSFHRPLKLCGGCALGCRPGTGRRSGEGQHMPTRWTVRPPIFFNLQTDDQRGAQAETHTLNDPISSGKCDCVRREVLLRLYIFIVPCPRPLQHTHSGRHQIYSGSRPSLCLAPRWALRRPKYPSHTSQTKHLPCPHQSPTRPLPRRPGRADRPSASASPSPSAASLRHATCARPAGVENDAAATRSNRSHAARTPSLSSKLPTGAVSHGVALVVGSTARRLFGAARAEDRVTRTAAHRTPRPPPAARRRRAR